MQKLFAQHGLGIFDVEELGTHGGTWRVFATRAEGCPPPGQRVVDMLQTDERAGMNRLAYYSRFEDRVQETKCQIFDFLIRAKCEGKSIAGYGAAGKTNTLLNYCGIRSNFMDCTVDRSPYKQGDSCPARTFRSSPQRTSGKPNAVTCVWVPGTWPMRSWIKPFTSVNGGKWLLSTPEVKVFS